MTSKGRGFLIRGLVGLSGTLLLTSCVSPFYGTARIEEGWHIDVGVAGGLSDLQPFCAQSDVVCKFAPNPHFQFHLRPTLGLGIIEDQTLHPFIDLASGFQLAYPPGFLTPALSVEFSHYNKEPTLSTGILLGIGEPEIVTLGTRLLIPASMNTINIDLFAVFHLRHLSLFTCTEILSPNGPMTTSLGAGYKIE